MCLAANADIIRWTITPSGGQITTNAFTRDQSQIGSIQVFKLLGKYDVIETITSITSSNIEFTLSTALSTELDGAEVNCLAIGRSTADSDSTNITVKGLPLTPQNLRETSVSNFDNSAIITLLWDHSFGFYSNEILPDSDNNYIISTDPATPIKVTPLQGISIDLEYHTRYILSVTAINCVGRSNPAIIQLGPYTSG